MAIERALRLLADRAVLVEEVSSLYRSEPVDAPPQPWFLNAVARVHTALDPRALLSVCQAIESMLGRRRTLRHGPRTIDLDLLLYGDLHREIDELQVPHPRLHLRRFVLVPFAEIAPETVHPVLGKSIGALLASCPDEAAVIRWGTLGRPEG